MKNRNMFLNAEQEGNGGGLMTADAPGQVGQRDATKQDGDTLIQHYVQAEALSRMGAGIWKHVRQCLKSGTALAAYDKAREKVIKLQAEYDAMAATPRGTNVRGGATRQELLTDVAGQDSAKERKGKIDSTLKAYGVARISLKDVG